MPGEPLVSPGASPTGSTSPATGESDGHGVTIDESKPELTPMGGAPPHATVRRRALVIGAVVAGVATLLYVVAAWAFSGRVPPDTSVAGVSVGGLGRSAAEDKLDDAARGVGAELPVRVGERTLALDVEKAGLDVDARGTVDSLVGFSLDPRALWRQVAGGGDRPAVQGSDDAALDGALEELGAQVRMPSKDAAITFDGVTPSVRAAVVGSDLDRRAAATAIHGSWLGGPRPVVLPLVDRQPKVPQAEAEKALRDLATPAVEGPLSVKVGSTTVSLPPAQFVPALAVAPDREGKLELKVDGDKLRAKVIDAAPQIGVEPKDARIELRGGKPVVVPAVEGVTIDPAALAAAVEPVLVGGGDRTATVSTTVRQPELTTAEAQKLGVKERVSTFSTNLTPDSRRTENLRIAARTVNGTLVLPGETFSLNKVLGERTPQKGYNQAPAISGGRLVRDYGGGVSQMATTIFNNVFFAGLEDIYHKPHSFYISRYPEGREATVNWPTVDLKWRNDSPYGVLIEASVGSKVKVSFWSTKRYDVIAEKSGRSNYRTPETIYDDGPGCVAQAPQSGFDVSVRRIIRQGGRVVKTETFRTAYIAEDRVVCGPKPDDAEGDEAPVAGED